MERKEELDEVLEQLDRVSRGLAPTVEQEQEEQEIIATLASGEEPVIDDEHVTSFEGDHLEGYWDCHYVLLDDTHDSLSEMDWDSWDLES